MVRHIPELLAREAALSANVEEYKVNNICFFISFFLHRRLGNSWLSWEVMNFFFLLCSYSFLQAVALEGQEANVVTDYILKVCIMGSA